jgi:hypothetical protein
MTPSTLALVLGTAALAGAGTLHLASQPEPYKPISTTDASYELILPPGTYQHLVFAFEGGRNSTVAKATVKAPSGDLTVLLPAGETTIVPLSAGGWTISQGVPIKLTQPASVVFISAMTQAGPVKLEPPKK